MSHLQTERDMSKRWNDRMSVGDVIDTVRSKDSPKMWNVTATHKKDNPDGMDTYPTISKKFAANTRNEAEEMAMRFWRGEGKRAIEQVRAVEV